MSAKPYSATAVCGRKPRLRVVTLDTKHRQALLSDFLTAPFQPPFSCKHFTAFLHQLSTGQTCARYAPCSVDTQHPHGEDRQGRSTSGSCMSASPSTPKQDPYLTAVRLKLWVVARPGSHRPGTAKVHTGAGPFYTPTQSLPNKHENSESRH